MSEHVVVAPLVVALVTAILTLGTRRYPRGQRAVSLLGIGAYAVAVLALASRVVPLGVLTGSGGTTETLTYQVSNWPAPFGISLVADALSAFMLVLAVAVVVPALVFSALYVEEFAQRVSYHSLFHFMLAGVTGAFLTGDIFNLFVWFEVMLMPSYVLVVFYGRAEHTRAALQYTVLNLLGSAVMLVAIGGIYATVGTLNMADIARRLAHAGEFGIDPAPVLGLGAILFAVFALKAGIVPFQFWVPAAYRAAPAPIAAVMAGVTKKVGIYAIIRLLFTVFGTATVGGGLAPARIAEGLGFGMAGKSFLGLFGPVLFLMAIGSILLGGLGAVSRNDLDDILAYSSIGQVGFIVLALALAATGPQAVRTAGLIAALVYSLNHAIAKSALFLISGTVYEAVGSIRFDALGGLSTRRPILASSFFLGGIALVGIPPLTGFFGKLLVFDTAGKAIVAGEPFAGVALIVALAGAVLTIAYVSRAWNRAFWGSPSDPVTRSYQPTALVAVVAAFVLLVAVLGIGFDPVYRAAEAAAHAATDRTEYVEAVAPEVIG
ncbi:complex I subunit 5 family protein [Halorhabdus amylolytica]|uniref:complex I subunit 5 family protein n=1 Tax=Halorhabdus amylolytica TaxID=2559573 RepID=UPI0010A9DF2B|nr:proton-conducting transporter membrane subunit [Halorhabdus amylolytica]